MSGPLRPPGFDPLPHELARRVAARQERRLDALVDGLRHRMAQRDALAEARMRLAIEQARRDRQARGGRRAGAVPNVCGNRS